MHQVEAQGMSANQARAVAVIGETAQGRLSLRVEESIQVRPDIITSRIEPGA